jgi:predicted transcriptional regulator
MKDAPNSRNPVPGSSVERLSISVSSEDKAALEELAAEKKVSLAWVIRDAIAGYLESNHKPESKPQK